MNIAIALIITIGTIIILWFFCHHCSNEVKLLFIITTVGIFVYSGIGIAYTNVDNKYMLFYFIFIIILLTVIKTICGNKVMFKMNRSNKRYINEFSSRIDVSLEGMDVIITIITLLFFLTLFFQMIYPTNRLISLLNLTNFTSSGIHARRAEHNSYLLLKISDAINTATLPFFFVYLYNCTNKNIRRKIYGLCLCILWILMEFGKYNYLSRYELIIYFGFIVMYWIVCNYGKIVIDKKTVLLCIITTVILIPLLVSFTDIRLGRSARQLNFEESIESLIESECHYPEYYDICINNKGLINPLMYILWIIFLPVPSAIWSGKPIVQIAYNFTSLFTTTAVTASNYSNMLPSILGEAFLIFGENFFWIEAVILGIVIGMYFKYFLKSQKLSLLTAYMLLMLATIGRGGSQSYLSVIINGSIVLIVWLSLSQRIRIKKTVRYVK